MPYDPNMDESLFSKAWESEAGRISVSVYSYNKGIKKLQITRENRDGEGECYQINRGVQAVYLEESRRLELLTIGGELVNDDQQYSIGLQGFHFKSSEANLGLTNATLTSVAPSRVVTTSVRDVLEEYLGTHQNVNSRVEQRLVFR